MDKKLAAWVITKGKSCSQPCFPRSFEYCIFRWTWHPKKLSYQCVISRNSTAVTQFIKKQQHWNAKCDCSKCKMFVFNAKLGPSYIRFALEGQWPREVVNLLAKSPRICIKHGTLLYCYWSTLSCLT